MKNLVRVEILGRELALKSEEREERVKEIAGFVDGKIREAAGRTPMVPTLNLAILAAMNIADDYLRLRELNRSIEVKSERLIEMIDARTR